MEHELWLRAWCPACSKLNWVLLSTTDLSLPQAVLCWKCGRAHELEDGLEVDPMEVLAEDGLKAP